MIQQSIRPGKSAAAEFAGQALSRAAARSWLGMAVLLYLLQVLPCLHDRWLPDESWYAAPGYSITHGHGLRNPAFGPNEVENQIDARPPGTALVTAASFWLFGVGQATARLGSILAGLAVVFFTYFLARDVIGEAGALIATFVLATDNLLVLASRTVRPEALTVLAILTGLAAIKQYARTGRILWALLSGLSMAAGTYFHVTLLGYIAAIGVLTILLDYKSRRFPIRGAIFYSLGYAAGLLPFAAWLLTNPMGATGFHQEFMNRAAISLGQKLLQEGRRYPPLLGLNMLHGHGLDSIPVRLPIVLFILAASCLLWKLRRQWFYLELLLLLPSLAWFIYLTTKTPRYFALLAPVFALTVGAAYAVARSVRGLRRTALPLCCMVIAAQFSANIFLLLSAHKANYDAVAAELRRAIPAGETAYGGVTFWLALHDHPYISYERTDPWMAANKYHARYFIAGDLVMTGGLQGDEAFYADLRRSMAEVIAQSRLAGAISDPYYGDLNIYELRAP